MSFMQDITYISVTGSKKNVTRMLNAAIRNVGTSAKLSTEARKVIVDGDDIETVNLKIKEEDGRYGFRVALIDLFDEVSLKDVNLQEKIKSLQGDQESDCKRENEEDFYGDGEATFARMFDLQRVRETEDEYTVDIEIYECDCGDCGYYGGWDYFEDIARLYQCHIIADDELFRNGVTLGLDSTTIWEPEGDGIKKTIIHPENNNSCSDIEASFAPLMQLDSQRYRRFKIIAYEILIYNLEYQTKEAKAAMERYQAMEEDIRTQN